MGRSCGYYGTRFWKTWLYAGAFYGPAQCLVAQRVLCMRVGSWDGVRVEVVRAVRAVFRGVDRCGFGSLGSDEMVEYWLAGVWGKLGRWPQGRQGVCAGVQQTGNAAIIVQQCSSAAVQACGGAIGLQSWSGRRVLCSCGVR